VAEHRVEHVMGMPVSIDVPDGVRPRALDEVFEWLRWVDATFSTYRPDSDISRLDCSARAHPLVHEVLVRCDALRAATRGYFDVRAGGRLDPSGFVKGWAVDHAAKLLENAGAERFCLNAGGDVVVRGGGWRIGIQHPYLRHRLAAVIELSDGAVATSGAYERGAHILDPHTCSPPRGVLSVTVIGPELALADVYATAAFAMGRRGPRWTATLEGHDAMTILDDERVLSTPGFLDHQDVEFARSMDALHSLELDVGGGRRARHERNGPAFAHRPGERLDRVGHAGHHL
jgi:thiamine biosynthesis lipoprotein